MTTDEILQRHGLAISDIVQISDRGELLYADADYAMIWEVTEPKPADADIIESCGFQLIGYYPEHEMYLVKRKVSKKDTMTITASMDYRFGYDKLGRFAAWGRNFVLEGEW
ncbi:hypothetical protein LCGC14_1425340 [marine sediment metagenome]|uniref:Uncharacterized protein n=1 Tax=marine sediment metagenome TaxID=412755 RepID=A0A0F9JQM0_9ZZZZ